MNRKIRSTVFVTTLHRMAYYDNERRSCRAVRKVFAIGELAVFGFLADHVLCSLQQ